MHERVRRVIAALHALGLVTKHCWKYGVVQSFGGRFAIMYAIHVVFGTPSSVVATGGGRGCARTGSGVAIVATHPRPLTNVVPEGHDVSTFAAHTAPFHDEPVGQSGVACTVAPPHATSASATAIENKRAFIRH